MHTARLGGRIRDGVRPWRGRSRVESLVRLALSASGESHGECAHNTEKERFLHYWMSHRYLERSLMSAVP